MHQQNNNETSLTKKNLKKKLEELANYCQLQNDDQPKSKILTKKKRLNFQLKKEKIKKN